MSTVLPIGRTSDFEVTNTWAETTPDASAGDTFPNDADTVLIARNSDNADHTITVTTQSPDGIGDLLHPVAGTEVYTIPAGKVAVIGPFHPSKYGLESEAEASVHFKASSNLVKVAALSLAGYPNDPFGMRG